MLVFTVTREHNMAGLSLAPLFLHQLFILSAYCVSTHSHSCSFVAILKHFDELCTRTSTFLLSNKLFLCVCTYLYCLFGWHNVILYRVTKLSAAPHAEAFEAYSKCIEKNGGELRKVSAFCARRLPV